MTIKTHNWASSAHQELHKIVREEIFPIVNQVDARVQNFEIQLLKEAVKFVRDFKSLANEADASLAKHKNEVKSIIVTLQRVVKQRMTIETHNWSSSAHQELHKIIRDKFFPIVNQVDARLQYFKIQFLKEAAKFVGEFKSLANEADASLSKHKTLELEIERLLKAVVSQDIMIIVQNKSVIDVTFRIF
nr:hypothetical protein [Tanacetum cinerariifolium]